MLSYILLLFLFIGANCEDPLVYRSYQTTIYCKGSHPIQYPKNALELQAIIKTAIARNSTVKVFGGLYSITDIICTEGIPVSTSNINYTRISDTSDTVTVGSGAQLIDVLDTLHGQGRTLVHVPTFGGITIGGAIGTGAHGSTLRHPTTISDQVVGLTIIDGNGEFRTINDAKELRAFRVHLGLLGAIVDVTLKTVPSFKMTVTNYLDLDSILLNGVVLKEARIHDWYEVWWFPSTKSVVVSKGNYSGSERRWETSGNAFTNLIPDLSSSEIESGRESLERSQSTKNLQAQYSMEEFTSQSLHSQVMGKPPIFTEDTGNGSRRFVNPATGYAYRLQANRCSDKCAWDNGKNSSLYPEESAFAFPVNDLPKIITRMRNILDQIPAAFGMIGVFIRFSKASDGLMALGAERDSVHVEWVTPMRWDKYNQPKDRIGAYQALQQALTHEFDGRPHYGKNGLYYFTRDILKKRPRHLLREFQRMMKEYDPNGIFMNKFGRRVLLESDALDMDPLVTKCALQDYCLCRKGSDCADFQICTKFGGLYPICREMILVPGMPPPYIHL